MDTKKERPDCGNSRDESMRNTSDHIVAEERGDVKWIYRGSHSMNF